MTEVEKICSYFERNSQLRVLFIFDNRMLADTLKDVDWEQLGYRYVVFNGSWFKTKYNIYHEWANDKIILLFPNRITPLGNYDAMKKFPLLDVLVANMEYKPTSHEQFMQEYGIPIQFAEYVSKHVSKLDQVQVKRVLQNYYNADAFNTDIANRGLLSVALGQDHLLDWIEIIVRTILEGKYNASRVDKKDQATNYWWGMISGAVDITLNDDLPAGTRQMIEVLRQSIISGEFNPFDGELRSQNGLIRRAGDKPLSSMDVITMNWLNENIIGEIPAADVLNDEARATVSVSGVK